MGKKDEELKAVHSTVEESKKAINSFECMRKREKELEIELDRVKMVMDEKESAYEKAKMKAENENLEFEKMIERTSHLTQQVNEKDDRLNKLTDELDRVTF